MTPGNRSRVAAHRGWRFAALISILILCPTGRLAGQTETARVTAPSTLTFTVPDVRVSTQATAPITISFDQAVLRSGRGVRISVKADGDLSPPGGPAIQASSLSWTTTGAVNGIGVNGTLSRNAYRTVFEGRAGAVSGQVTLTWSVVLSKNNRAGTHQGSLRWLVETFVP
jgi:hypothetical protein